MFSRLNAICIGILFLFKTLTAEHISIGLGGYTTDLPAGALQPSNRDKRPVSPKTAKEFSQVPQTNHWWSSLIWSFNPEDPWSEPLLAHPLSFKARAQGMEVGYPDQSHVTSYTATPEGHFIQEYHYPHVKDLVLGVAGLQAEETKVKSYTDWTVTAEWSNGIQTLQITIGSGLPFAYVIQAGGNALITCEHPPVVWHHEKEVIGLTVNQHRYGIFSPANSDWTIEDNHLQSSLNGLNYYSVAILPDNKKETLELFRQHAYAFVTNTKVEWHYDEKTARLNTHFNVETILKEKGPKNNYVNQPLLALYRHQWLNLEAPFLSFQYQSPRGMMKVIEASSFSTNSPVIGTLPFLPLVAQNGIDTYQSSQLKAYIDQIYHQTPEERWRNINLQTDSYWTGKALARIARLIPIADQIGHSAARDLFLQETKQVLQRWLNGKEKDVFYYNSTWKSLIGYPASYGSETQLNDHHFHYGYFIMAAALVAYFDPEWGQETHWGGMINLLIKDVANWDRNDLRFPFLRNFDIYEGHSWASGPAMFWAGNNEESSSEDLNFAAAVALWGSVTQQKTIRDLGLYLYLTETASIPQYWFDVEQQVFPPDFKPVTLDLLWGDGGAYASWGKGTIEEMHGINFLPIQPGLLYLEKFPDYLKRNQQFMLKNKGRLSDSVWLDIHLSIQALYETAEAIKTFNAHSNYQKEFGESQAHTYYWIHNLNQLGKLDQTIKANLPTAQVFNKDGKRTYVGYNPGPIAFELIFSDGMKIQIPPQKLMVLQQKQDEQDK